ncbi:MAG TPA: flagellar type III secretion system pore protein FliP [Planctomycetota bacterium]|nr:flagellar type III secretion system pore protein FliP [Planctomycetota bacterium]
MSCLRWIASLALVMALSVFASASQTPDPAGTSALIDQIATSGDADQAAGPGVEQIAHLLGEERMSTAVEIAILLTVLSLLPAILITITSFTRIVIVLSFVRRAMSTNELPPNPVIIGLALFLTTFVMAPVAERIQEKAWKPYSAGTATLEQAGDAAWVELSHFLIANTRQSEIDLFKELAHDPQSETAEPAQLPLRVVVPAFVLSELKTSFQMGFLLFLPFLVIDLVVSSVLLSMGMFMLPPVMVSTPIKILLFVLVDGWHLVCHSLVTSFVTT